MLSVGSEMAVTPDRTSPAFVMFQVKSFSYPQAFIALNQEMGSGHVGTIQLALMHPRGLKIIASGWCRR